MLEVLLYFMPLIIDYTQYSEAGGLGDSMTICKILYMGIFFFDCISFHTAAYNYYLCNYATRI